jgi:hypothetical protein
MIVRVTASSKVNATGRQNTFRRIFQLRIIGFVLSVLVLNNGL